VSSYFDYLLHRYNQVIISRRQVSVSRNKDSITSILKEIININSKLREHLEAGDALPSA